MWIWLSFGGFICGFGYKSSVFKRCQPNWGPQIAGLIFSFPTGFLGSPQVLVYFSFYQTVLL